MLSCVSASSDNLKATKNMKKYLILIEDGDKQIETFGSW
jgi:hypothetical protein